MPENKTKLTAMSTAKYLGGIDDGVRRKDCEALAKLMADASGEEAKMWGAAIVGFGTYRHALAGGKTGETCAVGFSSRKRDISIYGIAGPEADTDLLDRLGKYERGKGCVYVRRLEDVDAKVLGRLVADAVRRKQR